MSTKRVRIAVLMIASLIIGTIIIGKMFYVQVLANEQYEHQSLQNRLKEVDVTPNRGTIFDKNGEALAVSVEKQSVYIVPNVINASAEKDAMIQELAKALNLSKKDVAEVVETDKEFAWLKRHIEDDEAKAVKKLNYIGVGMTPEFKREYPKDLLASQLLGFCGTDNSGLSGVELSANDILGGKPGSMIVEYDNAGNLIPQSVRKSIPAKAGNNVYLTIDEAIQYIMERELTKTYREYDAKNVIGITMDVHTGEILGMVTLPEFNPNQYEKYDPDVWTNQAVSRLYEPGSVFKAMSGSMGLEEAIVTLDSRFFCDGSMDIDGHEFRCWSYKQGGNGALNFKESIAMSCNISLGQTALGLGMDRFYEYLRGFGLTEPTGVMLPGESSPIILDQGNAVPLDLASMAIGQTNAFTPIQMVRGLCAVANGGYLLKPQIVSKVTDRDDALVKKYKPEEVRQVISEETSMQMREALEYVVTDGLGKEASVPGYKVAGKTGTAEIAYEGRYLKSNYIMSFGGFAPADDPKIACLVIVDSPKTQADSGTVCGPAFSSIVGEILRYMEIPQTTRSENTQEPNIAEMVTVPELKMPISAEEARMQLQAAGLNATYMTSGSQLATYLPAAGTKVAKGSTVELYAKDEGVEEIVIPDLTGKTIKETERILKGFGMVSVINGSGLAYRQAPAAGSSVHIGDAVNVWFGSTQDIQLIGEAQEEVKRDTAKRKEEELEKEKKKTQEVEGSEETSD